MEQIKGRIPERYYSIKQEITNWNFEKLEGIGAGKRHDKYAILELNIYLLSDYPGKGKISGEYVPDVFLNSYYSYIVWGLSEWQFPKDEYEYGKKELIRSAEAVVDLFSIIKGQRLDLVFEIVWAGYHPVDPWGKGVVSEAFINAVLSCFDKNLFKQGLEHKKNHHYINGEYQSRWV